MTITNRLYFICVCLLLLSGCWNSEEIDEVALVHGVGFDKKNDKLMVSTEIIKPTSSSGNGNLQTGDGQHIVLEIDSETFFEGARDFIRYSKRRLNFEHCLVWIISENLAKEEFVNVINGIQRDQMFRLNSYIFITEEDPTEILAQPTLYEDLVANELVSALDQTQYLSEISPMRLREFFHLIQGVQHNAHVPIIQTKTVNEQQITSIEKTAIIKDNKMVGKLNSNETFGLNWINNKIKGGGITVGVTAEDKVSVEIMKANTKLHPVLKGDQLFVTVTTTVEATLADNWRKEEVDRHFLEKIETLLEKQLEQIMTDTMEVLQEKYKTDITQIGTELHRIDPKGFHRVESRWNDEVFANAKINYNISAEVTHPGLIINSGSQYYDNKPSYNPFQILLKGAL